MSDIVDQARKALEGTTPGQWRYFMGDICADGPDGDDRVIAGIGKSCGARSSTYSPILNHRPEGISNANFIAAARELVPAMAEEIERLRAEAKERAMQYLSDTGQLADEIERLRAALRKIAKQRKTDELESEYDLEAASYEDGFDYIVDSARAALEGKG